jgi:hypothetical protein
VFTTKQSVALYKWGRACFDIGVNTVEDAYGIFAEHQGQTCKRTRQRIYQSGILQRMGKITSSKVWCVTNE